MPNDAVILCADNIRFKWPTFKRFRSYIVAVAADNEGNIQVSEYPGKHQIVHKPNVGKPHVWDFGFDGHLIYNKTGGIPDVVAYSLILVRDRGRVRRAGEIMAGLADNHGSTLGQLASTAAGASAGKLAMEVIIPIVGWLGDVLKQTKDKVLDSMQGAKFFGQRERQLHEIVDTTRGAIADADLSFSLFDAASDDDTTADISDAVGGLVDDKFRIEVSKPGG